MPDQEVEHIQKNDIGTVIYMVVVDEDDDPVNITTAYLLEMKFKKPVTGTVILRDAIVHDGSGGVMKYTLISGDADEVGLVEAQGYVEMPGWQGHTSVEYFYVDDNLGGTRAYQAIPAYVEGT
jgi:hypothetical protein